MALSVLVLAVSLFGAACGSDESDSGDDARSASSTEVVDGTQATAELEVVLTEIGGKDGAGIPVPEGMRCTKSIPATCSTTVTCPVAEESGDLPGALTCIWLAGPGRDALLDEPGEREACTLQYGGPEVATITGTLDGDEIDATFSRQDGCAIARFDAVMPLWAGVPGNGAVPDEAPPTPNPNPDAPVGSPPDTEPGVIDDPPEAFPLEPAE